MKTLITNKIILEDTEYPYVIERKKIKNIYFRVKDDLLVHVSANRLISEAYIKTLLLSNAKAIKKMYLVQLERQNNQDLFYLGNKLNFTLSNSRPYIENDVIYGASLEACQKYIYSLAYEVFSQRLERLKAQFNNLPDFTLKVRKMTSKWGVCNKGSMSVTLNAELITKDVSLIDYVIIHELCHFKYMNHSVDYWHYVAGFCPYYKKMRKELKY